MNTSPSCVYLVMRSNIQILTSFSLLQSISLGQDQGCVRSHLAHQHGERAARDVGLIELDMHVVDAVFLGQEAGCVQVLVYFLSRV